MHTLHGCSEHTKHNPHPAWVSGMYLPSTYLHHATVGSVTPLATQFSLINLHENLAQNTSAIT